MCTLLLHQKHSFARLLPRHKMVTDVHLLIGVFFMRAVKDTEFIISCDVGHITTNTVSQILELTGGLQHFAVS